MKIEEREACVGAAFTHSFKAQLKAQLPSHILQTSCGHHINLNSIIWNMTIGTYSALRLVKRGIFSQKPCGARILGKYL
jgi:hypothetical protein